MNRRTEILTGNFTPVMLISVYRAASEITGEGEYYLESHDVNPEGQITEGKPLLQETIQDIVDLFFDERQNAVKVTGMMPENILWFNFLPGGNYKMGWYRPAEERVIHFAPELKISTGKAWMPAMLYVADRSGLEVFALKSNSRPKETTRLCYAPFFNVGELGRVCLGSANVTMPKEKTYENLMKYWEDLFWLSEFSHVNGDDIKTKTKLIPLWKTIMKSKVKPKWSELDELTFCEKFTLKNLLK